MIKRLQIKSREILIQKMIRIYKKNKFDISKPLIKFLTSKWFSEKNYIALDEYVKEKSNRCNILQQNEREVCYTSIHFFDDNEDKPLKFKRSKEYVITLNNAKIIGGSNLILLSQSYVTNDIITHCQDNIVCSDEGAVFQNKQQFIVQSSNYRKIDKGIYIGGNYSFNYYHLLLEFMTKFFLIEKYQLDKSIPLIVDKKNAQIPQYKELLNYLNTDRREVFILKKGQTCIINTLYHLSFPNLIAPNYKDIRLIKASDCLFDKESCLFVREKLLEQKASTSAVKKRIFISRENAGGKRNYNEEPIFAMLKKYSFSKVNPEKLSLAAQISLFNNAEIIIGATGAAFTNLLYCSANTQIICLTNYKIDISIFSTLAKILGLNLIYFYDETLPLNHQSDLHDDFSINVTNLENYIKPLLV